MTADVAIVGALVRRARNEIFRVPGAAIPGVLAPTIFMLGLTAVFSAAAQLPGFTSDDFKSYIVPVSLLQGAGFTGAATGVNLARDIEQGWFDRLLLAPASRATLLLGIVLSASLRALMPASLLLVVGFSLGVHFPGIDGLLVALAVMMVFAAAMACWGVALAMKFRTQQAAPLMQVGNFILTLFTTAYAPKDLLTGWMKAIATINPVTMVLEGVRQGFVGGVNWHDTWTAVVSVLGVLAVFAYFAVRGLQRYSDA
jgi:ABC-2 type transport system permease protein